MNNRIFYLRFFLLFFIISCTLPKEKYNEYRINDLSKPIYDTLIFAKKNIIRVEIFIKGNIKGNAVLYFEGSSKKITLDGIINDSLDIEWYESKLAFRYLPEKNIKGDSLTIRYRMY